MENSKLSAREIQESDIELVWNYWNSADPAFLLLMGVDVEKLPSRIDFLQMLKSQLSTPIHLKRSYCLIWEINGMPVGHCNTNPTFFDDHAFMHLHIWNEASRKKGYGEAFLKLSLPVFFEKLQLKKLYSEPSALNPAPNKTLQKAGFEFEKENITTPGSINFEQPVKRWKLTIEKFHSLQF